MRAGIISAIALAATLGLSSAPTIAQRSQKDDADEGARRIFVTKRAEAMQVVIYKLVGGGSVPVAPCHEFTSNDEIRIEFRSNFDGFIYFVNISPNGERSVIFPYDGMTDNKVLKDLPYVYPGGQVRNGIHLPPGSFKFDAEKGTEVVQVILSRFNIEAFDQAVKRPGGLLDKSAPNKAADLPCGITNSVATPALPDRGSEKFRTRDIILAPGKDKDKDGWFVAVPEPLKQGETAVFEIRLKHV